MVAYLEVGDLDLISTITIMWIKHVDKNRFGNDVFYSIELISMVFMG
jgi:hypothetical protein